MDEKLIVVGDYTCETQIFDLVTQSWSIGSRRAYCGSHHGGSVINGIFYLFGGWSSGNKFSEKPGKLVQAYDVASDTWDYSLDIPVIVGSPAVMTVKDIVYLCGGVVKRPGGSKAKSDLCFSRDFSRLKTSEWIPIPSMVYPVHHTAHGVSDDGSLYIFGGKYNNKNTHNPGTDLVQMYRPGSSSWIEIGAMPIARGGMGYAPFLNGEFYVMGGETPLHTTVAAPGARTFYQVLAYSPKTLTWRSLPDMPVGMHGIFPVVDVTRNRIYVAGGGDITGISKTSRFDILVDLKPEENDDSFGFELPAARNGRINASERMW